MSNIVTKIYGLIDPSGGNIFYVGRTSGYLCHRLRGHIKESRNPKRKCPRIERIRDILSKGDRPGIVQLAEIVNATIKEAEQAEQAWIDFYSLTIPLTNVKPASAGGIGTSTGVKYKWTPEIIARLGKEPDIWIAKDIGCTDTAVAAQRIKRGIPKFHEMKWTPELIAKLGTVSDQQVAKEMGVYHSIVRTKRVSLGIPPYDPAQWTDEKIALLGTKDDKTLSREIGLSQSMIAKKRKELGIPACKIKPPRKTAPGGLVNNLPQWVIDSLGKMTDAELSRRSGIEHCIIWKARTKKGIPSFSEQTGHPTRFKSGRNRINQIDSP